MKRFVLWLALAILGIAPSIAADVTGVWRTIDDDTGKERSRVRISMVDATAQGVVEEVIEFPGDDPSKLCKKCEGERKDKPIVGMTIMWALKKKSDTQYDGGQILDPNNGKVYRCKLKLLDDGKKLEVRGYIGISLIGRSQTWLRAE